MEKGLIVLFFLNYKKPYRKQVYEANTEMIIVIQREKLF
jgi:hypothetical protein